MWCFIVRNFMGGGREHYLQKKNQKTDSCMSRKKPQIKPVENNNKVDLRFLS